MIFGCSGQGIISCSPHSISCVSNLCHICVCCGAWFKYTECMKSSWMPETFKPFLSMSPLSLLFCPRVQCTTSGLVASWCCSWIDGVNQLPKLCLCFITPICWFLTTGARVEVHFTGRSAIDCIRFELSSYGFTISSMLVCYKSVRIENVVGYTGIITQCLWREKFFELMAIHSLMDLSDLYLM